MGQSFILDPYKFSWQVCFLVIGRSWVSLEDRNSFAASKANGEWPKEDGCQICVALAVSACGSQSVLEAHIKALHDKVDNDIQALEEHAAAPTSRKRKIETDTPKTGDADASGSLKKEVKKESNVMVKQEPLDTASLPRSLEPSALEMTMGKDELMVLHGIKKLDRDSNGKKFPVACSHCDKIFCAKNRAKIWQHCSGGEHRQRWKGAVIKSLANEKEEQWNKSEVEGKCEGLQLSSELGKQTRLGSDLKEVWLQFTKFANLEQVEGISGQKAHLISHDCNLNSWNLRSARCEGQSKLCKVSCHGF